jgi:hypothetical protein
MSIGLWAAKMAVSAVVGAGAEQVLGINTPPTPSRPQPSANAKPVVNDDDIQAQLRSLPTCCGATLAGKSCSKCGAKSGKRGK